MRRIFNSKNKKEFRRKLRADQTIHEKILWARLRRNQLGVKFRRQHSIGRYVVDFYCPEKKLIIELDGRQHGEQVEYDAVRTKYFEGLGMRMLRFWDGEMNMNLDGVLRMIEQVIRN